MVEQCFDVPLISGVYLWDFTWPQLQLHVYTI